MTSELRRAVAAVNAPGVHLAPWSVDTVAGGPLSARGNSIGIRGGCHIEHDHKDPSGACVLTEFAAVWNNDASKHAEHPDNEREVATARAMVAAFNFMSEYGHDLLMLLHDMGRNDG